MQFSQGVSSGLAKREEILFREMHITDEYFAQRLHEKEISRETCTKANGCSGITKTKKKFMSGSRANSKKMIQTSSGASPGEPS